MLDFEIVNRPSPTCSDSTAPKPFILWADFALKRAQLVRIGCFRCALQRLSGKARQSYGFSLECTSFLDENQQVTFFFSHFARCIRHNTGKETSDETGKWNIRWDSKGDNKWDGKMRLQMIRENETSDDTGKWNSKGDRHLYARAICCKASMLHTKNNKTKLKLGKLKKSWRGVGGSWRGRKKDQIGRWSIQEE